MRASKLFALSIVLIAPAAMSSGADAALVISRGATSNVTCAAGVCTATAADAVLNIKDVKAFLKAGDLKIVSGSAAQDIAFNATLNWTKPSRLSLDAYRSITFTQPVTAEGTGAVTLLTNDGGTGGDYSFTDKGKIAFWDLSSSLIINDKAFTLAGDIATLASDIAAHPSRNYALARGYDASVDGTYSLSPIVTVFDGVFDGLGHAITSMSIFFDEKASQANIGLFMDIGVAGEVRDLQLKNPTLKYKSKNWGQAMGALAASNEGKIRNVDIVGGTLSGNSYVGGLVGSTTGLITNCHVFGTIVSSMSRAGGLAQYNNGSMISSGSSATVVGGPAQGAGGFVDSNSGVIKFSWSTGLVNGGGGGYHTDQRDFSGGFVEYNDGSIDQSWTTSIVEGGEGQAGEVHESDVYAGGFIAWNQGKITRSYAMGSVEAGDYGYIGGFDVYNREAGTIDTSYTIASLDCRNCELKAPFIVEDCPNGKFDYWNTDISPRDVRHQRPSCSGLTGLTTEQFQSGLPSGFDSAIWGQSAGVNNGYPYLLANPPVQ